MTKLAVQGRRLDDIEGDINTLGEAQRAAIAEVRSMLKEALAAVDASCRSNVEGVRKEVAELKRQTELAVWSRADKLSAAGLFVLIVLTVLGMVLK